MAKQKIIQSMSRIITGEGNTLTRQKLHFYSVTKGEGNLWQYDSFLLPLQKSYLQKSQMTLACGD